MEILNIGIQEFFIILVIAIIILGPDRIVSTGRKLGELIRKTRTSETWKMLMNASQGLRNIPKMLADETGFEYEQFKKDVMGETEALKKSLAEASDGFTSWRVPLAETNAKIREEKTKDAEEFAAWTTASPPNPHPPPEGFQSIAPPNIAEESDTPESLHKKEETDQPEKAE